MPARAIRQPVTAAAAQRCVLYARVSSKDQAVEGFSIPAQQRLLRDYAASKGLRIMEEFIDVETARRAGRENFNQMIEYLRKHAKTCTAIIVEKTDRLLRNLKDASTLEDLGVNMHFVKENVIIGPESRSAEQFVFGIKVLVARQYSSNLSEESKKGQTMKAAQGLYPSFAPAGYKKSKGHTANGSSSRCPRKPRSSTNSTISLRRGTTASKPSPVTHTSTA